MANFWACACKLSWTLSSRARLRPLCHGAHGTENTGTGLPAPGTENLNKFPGVSRRDGHWWNWLMNNKRRDGNLPFAILVWRRVILWTTGLLKIRHSRRFVAVVLQILIPFVILHGHHKDRRPVRIEQTLIRCHKVSVLIFTRICARKLNSPLI